ncbi:hypothetical protein JL475_00250 [Streptomyces sp. M2CJ-2]|uniref:hypothetical protein n=1 Tax=Streptomyces sp. M2CJ-2 TaxID=2803948 RepID=UPI0019242974|nr:hypothetical protein [Streptomyces sp. M2CJ-2]MBL3664476.1 hypothetical protein [Streptomyces sp. M2CJ-2]
MDIATAPRDKGVYVIRTVGTQKWTEDTGTWQAHGVRLDLMDGHKRLAICKLEVPGTQDAEERGTLEATRIEPWVRTLRYLSVVRDLRSTLAAVEDMTWRAADDAATFGGPSDAADELLAYATQDEADTLQGAPLGRAIADRLQRQIGEGLRRALAFAPDPASDPIHPAWEQPALLGQQGESLAQATARELLAGWAIGRDLRDPLITWAVQDAGLTRTEVQQTTSVSRSTINRLLPA